LVDDESTRLQYPFSFDLTVRYRVSGDCLECVFSLANPDDVPLYASVGAHPGFRWPLADGPRDAHAVIFERPEPNPIRRLAGGLLAAQPAPSPVVGNVLRLNDSLFADNALIFDRLSSRSLVYGAPGGPAVRIDFGDFPELGIWTKPGAGYLCLEPWQGVASPVEFVGEFRDKPGVVAVAPRETRTWRYSIHPLARMPELG